MRGALAVTLCVLVAGLGWGAAPASARTITVTSTLDSGSGSLREALVDAQNGDTIVVPGGTINLAERLQIVHSVTIEGQGPQATVISGSEKNRVFEVESGVTATISGIDIKLGKVSATKGTPARGGGIVVEEASLTLAGDRLEENEAAANGNGGENGGTAEGGAVYADAKSEVVLLSSVVRENFARALGIGSHGGGAAGGGIYALGTLRIAGGEVSANTSDASGVSGGLAYGGGIAYEDASATRSAAIEDATIAENEVDAVGETGGTASGGGLKLAGPSPERLAADTIYRNGASASGSPGAAGSVTGAGAVVGGGPATLVNLTIDENMAIVESTKGAGGTVEGGGLKTEGPGPSTLTNSTVISNDTRVAGTPAGSSLGAELATAANISVENTIVAQGPTGGKFNCHVAPGGAIASLGGNIDSGTDCGFTGAGDRTNTDPLLGALQSNGGPVQTIAPQSGSPAIDGGQEAGCPSTDARGVLRPAGAACDIGAFEVGTPSALTGPASGISTSAATLTGTARNPDLAAGAVSFQYGTSTAYGTTTAAQPIGATSAGASFAVGVAGLAARITYHYRIVITNAVGTALGADRTFTTAAAPSPTQTPMGGGTSPTLTASSNPARGGSAILVTLTCEQAGGCAATFVATTKERVRDGRVTALIGRLRTRTVTVATGTTTLTRGAHLVFALKLNAIGRRLERQFGRLPVTVSIYLGKPGPHTLIERVHVVLRPAHKHVRRGRGR